jgi:hypothetical protein
MLSGRVFLPERDKTPLQWCSIARGHYDEVSLPSVKWVIDHSTTSVSGLVVG